MDLFKDSSEIPFSRVYEAGVGECLEKAVLVQLSERGRKVFLIEGSLAVDYDVDYHAYNVVFKDGRHF